MTRLLDWLDESAAGLIRVAYLLAGVIAVANYFADGNVPLWLAALLNAILPWALAGALEIHTYLTARRVRKSWQDWSAAALGSDEHERAAAQMKLNLWILAALLAFSMYNQLQYLAQTWTPPHTPLTPPGFWPYLIRATITPAAFMAAAFLAPVGEGLALQVQSQAHALAVATFKVATQQWKRRLRQMQQAGQDVTGALVQLVDDPAERRVISAIWQAMQHPEATALGGAGMAQSAQNGIGAPVQFEATGEPHTATHEDTGAGVQHGAESSVAPDGPDKPPTGPGSPSVGSNRTPRKRPAPVLRLTPERTRTGKRTAARANARSGQRGTAGERVRSILAQEPGIDFEALVRRANVSRSTASKYVALVASERTAAQSSTADQSGQIAQ